MVNMILVICVILLALLAIQDFKYREFPVILAAAIFLILIYYQYATNSNSLNFMDAAINVLFISLNILALQIYYHFRIDSNEWFFDKAMGWGDVVFFLIPIFTLAPYLYIGFIVLSALTGLLYALFNKKKANSIGIPLAGIMAFYFGSYLSYLLVPW